PDRALSSVCSATFLFLSLPRLPGSTLFPYTTLFRSDDGRQPHGGARGDPHLDRQGPDRVPAQGRHTGAAARAVESARSRRAALADRKSTRLNSSHVKISYAVFCLKKKKKKI